MSTKLSNISIYQSRTLFEYLKYMKPTVRPLLYRKPDLKRLCKGVCREVCAALINNGRSLNCR